MHKFFRQTEAMTRAHTWLDRFAHMPIGGMAALLCFAVLDVFVVPFTTVPDGVPVRIAHDVLLSLVLLSGVAAVSDHRAQMMMLALVAGVAIVVRWAAWFLPSGLATVLRDATALVSLGVLAVAIGIKVFGAGKVTLDRIRGAVVLYILIGVVWADAYQLLGLHIPGAFAGVPHAANSPDRSAWIYYSFVTLTTVGYGDITPVVHVARSLAIVEALIGQLYPAIVLARLVSLQVSGSGSSGNPS